MKILHLVPLFVLAACSGQDAGNTANASAASLSTDGGWEPANGTAETPAALADADLPQVGQQDPRAPKISGPSYKASREAQFHFETDAISDAELKEFYVEMDITIDEEKVGTMTFELWGDDAPITVRNFLRYADEGFYDNNSFHRIVRDFMLQGGSANKAGGGAAPYPSIKEEFSRDPKRRHRYGVLSMAHTGQVDSASSQFFVITESRSPSTMSLNGKYSTFGILINGVSTLERIADIPTTQRGREKSNPTQKALITECRVFRGEPSVKRERMERPSINLGGEPESIRIQHVLISFKGTRTAATRTKEEAEKLANEILKRAQSGEDFGALVKEFTDDPSGKTTTPPGTYSMLNHGCFPPVEETEKLMALQVSVEALRDELMAKVNAKELSNEEAGKMFGESAEVKAMQNAQMSSWLDRAQMVAAFGDVGFALEVGEISMSQYDITASPFGWHIIRRYE